MIFSSLGAEHLWCKASTPPKSLISLCCICFRLKQLYSAIANSWVELTHFFCLQVWMSIKFGGWQWYKCAVRDGTPTLKSHWSKSLLIVIKYQIPVVCITNVFPVYIFHFNLSRRKCTCVHSEIFFLCRSSMTWSGKSTGKLHHLESHAKSPTASCSNKQLFFCSEPGRSLTAIGWSEMIPYSSFQSFRMRYTKLI